MATGLVALVPTVVSGFDSDGIGWRLAPFGVAAAAYLVSLPLVWLAYNPSDVRFIGRADSYHDGWLDLPADEVLRWTLFDMARLQQMNERLLLTKERWMRYSAFSVALEVIALVFGVLLVMV